MIKINGKYIRNVPEQVGKNKYDINALVNLIIDLDTKVNNLASGVYKPQGDATVAQLNALTVDSSMNGYVYNVTDSGTLTQGSVTVEVGDNVVIVWKQDLHTFEWDKLSGIVDLSNYVTLDTEQTISGHKIFSSLEGISSEMYSGMDYSRLALHGDEGVYITTGTSYRFVDVQGNLDPNADNTYDLGSSSKRFKDIYSSGNHYCVTNNGVKFAFASDGEYFCKITRDNTSLATFGTSGIYLYKNTYPYVTNTYDLGSSSHIWKDLYLGEKLRLIGPNYTCWLQNEGNRIKFYYGDSERFRIGNSEVVSTNPVLPNTNNTFDLGSSSYAWRDLFLARNLSNGTDSVTVADLAALITYARGQGWIS